jgi:hypothetical protein
MELRSAHVGDQQRTNDDDGKDSAHWRACIRQKQN